MKIIRNEPLKKHTSFHIGGPADYFCVPTSIAELKEALAFAREKRLPVAVMGGGTNLLVLDRGFRGLVVKLSGLNNFTVRGRVVSAGAGVFLPRLVAVAARRGLAGLEFLAAIPGTVGGAVTMNAGAWGKEIGRYVERVTLLNADGREKVLKREKLGFGYRKSLLQKGKYILVEATVRLRKGRPAAIRKKIKECLERRRLSQPLGAPNAGSVFKNPPGKFAGRMLEAAGCKGMRVGDAQVSARHANFILNLGEAKAVDVIKLMTRMRKAAKIKLEPELKIMVKSFS